MTEILEDVKLSHLIFSMDQSAVNFEIFISGGSLPFLPQWEIDKNLKKILTVSPDGFSLNTEFGEDPDAKNIFEYLKGIVTRLRAAIINCCKMPSRIEFRQAIAYLIDDANEHAAVLVALREGQNSLIN